MARPGTRGGTAAGVVLIGVTAVLAMGERRAVAQTPSAKPEPQQSTASAWSTDDEFDELFRGSLTSSGIPSETPTGGGTASLALKPALDGRESIRCDDMDIMGVAVAHKDAIRQCVSEQNKRKPGLRGKLVMRWSIQTNGRATDVSCQTPEFCSTYLAGCLSGLIQGWSFSKPRTQRGPIDFPFSF
ncbi:AgmX/PglI C-terminal domain-containing protein [Cystobacter fuscus]|uniref:AgmX/PglI C-terminal domain-containing protein n=1 Tax=Cystobacter fuscus TaxID=43 RepID=UPI0037C14630